jgi:hypothetical protein
MSEKRYRDLYDSDPQYVEGPGFRIKTAGQVSAEVVAKTYRKEGVEATIRPAESVEARTAKEKRR